MTLTRKLRARVVELGTFPLGRGLGESPGVVLELEDATTLTMYGTCAEVAAFAPRLYDQVDVELRVGCAAGKGGGDAQ